MSAPLPSEEQQKQIYYRDARTGGYYGDIWQHTGKCVFCDLRDKYIFYEENGVVMTVALFAYIDGNLMIIPRRHVRSAKELTPGEWETMRKMMYIAKKLIRKVHGLKGVQYILRDGGPEAQSTVGHLHLHCIPFDAPDLSVWNYRQLKYTPLENADLYKDQAAEIEKLSAKFDEKYAAVRSASYDKKAMYRQALEAALRSKKASQAKRTAQVGAAIISGDALISLPNASLTDDPMEEERDDGTWVSPPTVSHAEERCIAQAAKGGLPLQGATMIVTLSPCMMCARLIVNAGISEVHYIDDWWDRRAVDFLRAQGVTVVQLAHRKRG